MKEFTMTQGNLDSQAVKADEKVKCVFISQRADKRVGGEVGNFRESIEEVE